MLAGCATSSSTRQDQVLSTGDGVEVTVRQADDATRAAWEYVSTSTGGDNVSVSRWAGSVEHLLPNRHLYAEDGTYEPVTDTVVLGTVQEVRPDAAYRERATADGEARQVVAFGSEQADYRTWLVTLELEEVLAGESPHELLPDSGAGQVTIRLTTNGGPVDEHLFTSGIQSLGRSVWFLRVRRSWSDAFDTGWFGRAVATVDEHGSLTFPLVQPGDGGPGLAAGGGHGAAGSGDDVVTTVDDVRRLGAEPVVQIGGARPLPERPPS